MSSAIDILKNSHLVLLDPSTWDDKNDFYFINLYKNKLAIKSVQASCFTMATETYHHWRIFTQGSDGICIEFNREHLERILSLEENLRYAEVEYLPIKDLKNKQIIDLPFLKRVGYSDEREWRIFSNSSNTEQKVRSIPLDISCISRIVINPWMPESLVENVRKVLKDLAKDKISVEHSGLTNSNRWKEAGNLIQ